MGNNQTAEQLPFIPLHDDITLDEFLLLEPLLWVPEFRQLNYVTQEGIEKSQNPTGRDGEYTRRDIMTFFFNANLPGIYDLGLQQVAVTGDRNGGATYLLSDALRAVNFFIGSVIYPDEACSDLDDANVALEAFSPWGVCANVDEEKRLFLSDKHSINNNLLRHIFDENKKLKPLRPWLELQAWTVKDFCFLRGGKSPSDESFTVEHDTEMLLIRYLASCRVNPLNCDFDKAQHDLNNAAATGVGSICYGIQYKPADLINCAQKASIPIPYYMRPLEGPDPGLLPEVFNTSHANHSPELAAALECWLALYAGSPTNQIKLSSKKRERWLKEDCSFELPIKKGATEPSKPLYERIARVVNPKHNKEGGAIPTPEKKAT